MYQSCMFKLFFLTFQYEWIFSQVTWSYLNSTSGSKTITQSCNDDDDNNSDEDGETMV